MTLPGVLDLKSPVMKHAAMRCVFSMLSMSFFRYGFQTGSVLQEGVDKGDVSLLFAGRWAAPEISA